MQIIFNCYCAVISDVQTQFTEFLRLDLFDNRSSS